MFLYIGSFTDTDDIIEQFELNEAQATELRSANSIVALYSTPPYEGQAVVLYRLGEVWFFAEGCHCSCYGLEGQWEPRIVIRKDPIINALIKSTQKPYGWTYDEIDRPELLVYRIFLFSLKKAMK